METNLSLSFELICLMEWLLKHEKNMLNSLIKQAIKGGLAADLKHHRTDDGAEVVEQLYRIMIDFLSYLERALAENLDRADSSEKGQLCMKQLLHHIDRDSIDQRTVRASMREFAKQMDSQNTAEQEVNDSAMSHDARVHKILCKALLKEWTPKISEEIH